MTPSENLCCFATATTAELLAAWAALEPGAPETAPEATAGICRLESVSRFTCINPERISFALW
jgi:hypothetical protein